MSLTDLLRPGFRHSDPAVRLRAVSRMDDEKMLVQLACEDPDLDVRHRAVARLGAQDALRRVAIEGRHLDARLKAVARISDARVLAGIMRERKQPDLMMACFEGIRDQQVLGEIARDPEQSVTARRIAINMFADRGLLTEILDTVRAPGLRLAALERLGDAERTHAAATADAAERPHPDERIERLLERYDADVVAEMLGAFRDSPAAVRGLGAIVRREGAGRERAVEILGRLLKHAAPEIRLEALHQLGSSASAVADELGSLAESDPDPRVREAVGRVLAALDDGSGN